MSTATDILGKIGEKVGSEFSTLRVSLGTLYATKVSLGNVVNTIDFSPYSTKVSLNGAIVSLGGDINLKASKVSIDNLRNGTDIFTDLSATRASIGDLIVTGTTTTLNTETLNVEDNIIEVNLQSDGSETAQTGGIQVNRGAGSLGLSTATFTPANTEFKVECLPELLNTGTAGYPYSVMFHAFDSTIQSIYRGKYFRNLTYGVIHYYAVSNTQRWQDIFDGGQGSFVEPDIYESTASLTSVHTLNQVSDTKGFKITSVSQNATDAFPTSANGYLEEQFVNSVAVSGDKATIIWDDNSGQAIWKFGLGSADADIKVKDIDVSGSVKVPNANGIKINNTSLGDYATFENAFLANL